MSGSPGSISFVSDIFDNGVRRTKSYGHPVQDHSFDHIPSDECFVTGHVRRRIAYGYPAQHHFDHGAYLHGIKRIEIRSGEWINSLRVQYKSQDGEALPWTDRVGGDGGHDNPTIELEDGEYIAKVNGEFGRDDKQGIITSLIFTINHKSTNHKRYVGPFGKVGKWWRATHELHPLKIGGTVVAFHGTYGSYVSSIGCYTYGI